MNTRIEHDLLGDLAVPADAWYGIQTQRALDNFSITGVPISHFPELVRALAMVKAAAARANSELGVLASPKARAILDACDEIIGKDKVVAFSYTLSDDAGTQLEYSPEGEPMVYLHGHRNILPALERRLEGKTVGDEISATLPPGDAYGEREEDAIQRVPIKHLVTRSKRYQPGMVVRVNTKQGPRDVTITKVGKFNVDVDVNHPYAGKQLTFDIKVETIREATPEELSHGHAHGVAGHSHH